MANISGLNEVQGGRDVKTPYTDPSEQQVSVSDFLQLMIAQLKNQDFTNPVDDTQYVTQLAQFATMQQMQELAYYSKTNYVMSLVGKNVTVASLGLGGSVRTQTGPVEKIALSNNDFTIFVGGTGYKLNQIMTVNDLDSMASGEADKAENMAVMLMNRKADSAEIRWEPPTEDEAVAEKMSYSVYYSTDEDFNTVKEIKSNGTLVGETEGDVTSMSIEGLEPGTTYFVNVVVMAPDGSEKAYQKLVFTTLKD